MIGRGNRSGALSEQRARVLPAASLAVLAGLLFAIGGPSVGPAAAAPGLAGHLIAAAAMPAGWNKEAVPHTKSIPFVPTCPGVPSTADARTAQAVEGFRMASGVPAVVELLATYDAPGPAFALVQHYLTRCVTVAGPSHRSKYQFSVSNQSFPKTGEESVAFSTAFTGAPEITIESVVVREGDALMEITLSTKGAPNPTLLAQMVTRGINSLTTAAPG